MIGCQVRSPHVSLKNTKKDGSTSHHKNALRISMIRTLDQDPHNPTDSDGISTTNVGSHHHQSRTFLWQALDIFFEISSILKTGLSKDACQGRPVDKLVVFSTSGPYCRCKMIQAMTDSPPFRQWFTACEIYFGFGDSNGNISRMSILGEFCIQLSQVWSVVTLNWTELKLVHALLASKPHDV